MMRIQFLSIALAAAAAMNLACGACGQAALVIEPVFNRVDGSGPNENNFPIYDPEFLIDGAAYFTANEPGEIISYASGDPRDPFLDDFHVWNNTQYNLTGFTLRLIGTATDTANPGTIVRGSVDAVWGDVNGDSVTGLSDIFSSIIVSPGGKEIRFEDGLIPAGGRFTDIHLAMSDNPPDFAGIDSSFTGILAPEPAVPALIALAALCLVLTRSFGKRMWALAHWGSVATGIVLIVSAGHAGAAMFNVGTVAELIAAINTTNQNAVPDSIVLMAGRTYTLTDTDNSVNGWSGLPIIAGGEDLTILGNGATIERSTAADAFVFRLFHVAVDASLSLENVTLQHGRGVGTAAFAQGGAILNLGTLTLRNVVLHDNRAEGNGGSWARGGGVYSTGSLTVEGGAFEDNQALGGIGRDAMPCHGCPGGRPATRGGSGLGGAVYIADGAAEITDVGFVGNTARGGRGGNGSPGVGNGGIGAGGGLYVASGNVRLNGVTLADNSARGANRGNGNGGTGGNGNGGGLYAGGGTISAFDSSATGNSAQGGNGGQGTGGGLFIDANSSVGLNAFTAAHITNNTASNSDPNISGAFQTISNPNPLPGDFNNDGAVDAADYIVWRKGLGTVYTADDFNIWRASYGQTAGGGAVLPSAESLSAAVPEPRAGLLIVIGCVVALAIRLRRVEQRDVRFMTIRLCNRIQFHRTAFSTIVAAVSALLVGMMTAAAANFSFTNIADISGPFSRFNSFSINDNGKVAFIASLDAGGVGIFTGDGGPTALVVDDTGPFSGFGDIFTVRGGVSINNSDQVAFFGNLDVGGAGIFTTNGGNVTTIADTNGPVFRFADGGPSINDSGTVAFFAELDAGGGAILSGNGGPLTTIADNVGPGMFSLIFPADPSINNSGDVAFIANFNAGSTGERGIFTGSGGPTSLIVDGSGPLSSIGFAFPPNINDRGTVAYHAQFDTAAGEPGIFIGAGTIIVDSSGPFSRSFGHSPAINNRGTVAFNAVLDTGGGGIFTGPDPLADKVIRTGDSLFGSTVTAIGIDGEMNDNGDIPFIYGLANCSAGIAVAQRQPNVPVQSQIPQPELRAEASVEFRTNTPAGFTAAEVDTAGIPGRADAHASHPDFPTNTAFADAFAEVPIVPMSTDDLGKLAAAATASRRCPILAARSTIQHGRTEGRQVVKLTAIPEPGTNITDPVDIDMTLHFDGSLQQRLIGIWECDTPCDPTRLPDPGQLTTSVSAELNTFTALGRVTQFEASATLDWTGTEVLKLTATGPWAADFTPLVQPRQGLAGGSSVSSTQSLEDILSLAAGEEFTVELILRTEVFNHYISTRLGGISVADFFNSGEMSFSTDTPGVTIVLVPDTLPGDFNNDGEVDAADYIVWRNGLGTVYTADDFNIWRASYGQTAGGRAAGYPLGASAESLSAAVPEPSALAVCAIATICATTHLGRSVRRTRGGRKFATTAKNCRREALVASLQVCAFWRRSGRRAKNELNESL